MRKACPAARNKATGRITGEKRPDGDSRVRAANERAVIEAARFFLCGGAGWYLY
jgi:hypothetical protein